MTRKMKNQSEKMIHELETEMIERKLGKVYDKMVDLHQDFQEFIKKLENGTLHPEVK